MFSPLLILKDVPELSAGQVTLSTGTLYGALKRLLDAGWIERLEEPGPDATTRTPRIYRLTDLGRRVLSTETARLRRLVQVAKRHGATEANCGAGGRAGG